MAFGSRIKFIAFGLWLLIMFAMTGCQSNNNFVGELELDDLPEATSIRSADEFVLELEEDKRKFFSAVRLDSILQYFGRITANLVESGFKADSGKYRMQAELTLDLMTTDSFGEEGGFDVLFAAVEKKQTKSDVRKTIYKQTFIPNALELTGNSVKLQANETRFSSELMQNIGLVWNNRYRGSSNGDIRELPGKGKITYEAAFTIERNATHGIKFKIFDLLNVNYGTKKQEKFVHKLTLVLSPYEVPTPKKEEVIVRTD